MPDRPLIEQLDRLIEAVLAGAAPAGGPEEFADIVSCLRDLPEENFKARLRAELERRASMIASTPPYTREGFRTVTPYITVVEGDKFIEFLKHAFLAEEVARQPGSASGAFHAEVRIGDSMLMIGSGEHVRGCEALTALHVYLDDCDAAYRRAIAAGAKSLGEPGDRPYGERSGYVEDPFGNYWYIATRFASTEVPAGMGSVLPYLHPSKARPFIDFLKRAFGAEEMGVHEQGGHVMHAAVRIGDAVVEMGEPAGEFKHLPSGFFMYVEDVDRVYRQAVAAGATSIRTPGDRPYGHRDASVSDPFGYSWNVASLLQS